MPHSSASAESIRCTARPGPSNSTSPIASSTAIGHTSQARRFMPGPSARNDGRGTCPLCFVSAQEAEKLHAFAQTPLHHVPAQQHLAHDLPDLRGPEIEALVEALDVVIDLFARQMRITDRRELHPFLAHQVDHLVL